MRSVFSPVHTDRGGGTVHSAKVKKGSTLYKQNFPGERTAKHFLTAAAGGHMKDIRETS